MGANSVPSGLKSDLEKACKKAVDKVKKTVPGEKNEKKVAEALSKQVCKDVDQKLLKLLAEQIAKQMKQKNPKGPDGAPPKVDGKPKMKAPGSGSPNLTLPLANFDLLGDAKKDSKLELKIWGDPREMEKDKGAVLYFTVTF